MTASRTLIVSLTLSTFLPPSPGDAERPHKSATPFRPYRTMSRIAEQSASRQSSIEPFHRHQNDFLPIASDVAGSIARYWLTDRPVTGRIRSVTPFASTQTAREPGRRPATASSPANRGTPVPAPGERTERTAGSFETGTRRRRDGRAQIPSDGTAATTGLRTSRLREGGVDEAATKLVVTAWMRFGSASGQASSDSSR